MIRIIPLNKLNIEEWVSLFQRSKFRVPFYHPIYVGNIVELFPEDKKVALYYSKGVLEAAALLSFHKKKMGILQASLYAFRGSDHVSPLASDFSHLSDFFFKLHAEKCADFFLSGSISEDLKEKFNGQNLKVTWHFNRVLPHVLLPDSDESFFLRFSSKVRYNLRREARILKEKGITFHTSLSDQYTHEFLFRELTRLHAERFRTKKMASKFLDDAPQKFHNHLVQMDVDKEIVRFYYFKHLDKVIAILYGFELDGIFYFFMHGFDPAYSRLSVGKMLILHSILYQIKHGGKKFDFLRGNEQYKKFWTRDFSYNFIMKFPLTYKGMFYLNCVNLLNQIYK